jgi:hypothetical protein
MEKAAQGMVIQGLLLERKIDLSVRESCYISGSSTP